MNPIEKVLRHNINMMREHNKAPSFVQVLINFQLAADEIRLLTENKNHYDAGKMRKVWCWLFHIRYTHSVPVEGAFGWWNCRCTKCEREWKRFDP
jgi:hypothetical protein